MGEPDLDELRKNLDISRELARSLGYEAVDILKQGHYRTESGRVIRISDAVQAAAERTISYAPADSLPTIWEGNYETQVEVQNTTTLSAAKTLIDDGINPAALNMASATSPGGGFLGGARAQEEYLARSSGLYRCLQNNRMYQDRTFESNPFYADYVIYSPDVIVFRGDDSRMLENPFYVSILTSPAVHAVGVGNFFPHRLPEIERVMGKRIGKLLAVAANHRHDSLVLGAWGCGAFGNDGSVVSRLFKQAIDENFRGVFKKIVFAITDWSANQKFIGPFIRTFSHGD